MKQTYKIHFIGRLNNAIGITYPITEVVTVEEGKDPILKLYEKYEHIRVLRQEIIS